jgi:hypothetical protein
MSDFPQIKIKHNIGNTIEVPNQLVTRAFTYISTNLPIGETIIPVDNATDFTDGAILTLLSSMGAENAEFGIVASHTDQEFTVTATEMPHNRGDMVQEVRFDQIVLQKASSINGSYSVIDTKTFQVTQQQTVLFDLNGLTTDYYKVQWKNSLTGAVSSLSEPISVLAYPVNSVANLITPVLKAMGISPEDKNINTEFCISAVNDARKFTQGRLSGIRFAWREEFEHPVKVLAGNNYIDLPDDIDFTDTDRSVLAARFLLGNVLAPFNLRYIDKRSWNQVAFNVQGGVAETDVEIGDTTITLNSAGDFWGNSGGVAYVATTDYDQTIMQISYTGVDLTTNQLTGVTGVTRDIPAGTRVWSNPSIAQPIYYTVYDGKLFFERIIPDSMQGNNLYIDYYKKLDEVTDLYQELPEYYRDIYKFYLRYAIKYRKDVTLANDDADLKKFEDLLEALFNNLYTGQSTIIQTG